MQTPAGLAPVRMSHASPGPQIARFALRGHHRPELTQALPLAELVRRALMSHSQRLNGRPHADPLFSGKDETGRPLRGAHAHAFYLPCDDDGDGLLDHVTVYAPRGFDAHTRATLSRLERLYDRGTDELWTVLLGIGPADSMAAGIAASATLRPARQWRSRTPFLLTRHPKANGRDGIEAQLRLELRRRGWPDPDSVRAVPGTVAGGTFLSWDRFVVQRPSGHGRLALPTGFGFRLTFAEPVDPTLVGPLAIGYGCHFGLGQFIADT